MLTPKNTTFVVLKKTVVELVDIENEEERRKEDIYELQHRKEVKIVSELCKHPWHYYDKIKATDGKTCQIMTENDRTFYGPAFNSVIRDTIREKSKKKSSRGQIECIIVCYKFRSTPMVTFSKSHYLQEDEQLFFGPLFGTYQRQRVAWKAKKKMLARRLN